MNAQALGHCWTRSPRKRGATAYMRRARRKTCAIRRPRNEKEFFDIAATRMSGEPGDSVALFFGGGMALRHAQQVPPRSQRCFDQLPAQMRRSTLEDMPGALPQEVLGGRFSPMLRQLLGLELPVSQKLLDDRRRRATPWAASERSAWTGIIAQNTFVIVGRAGMDFFADAGVAARRLQEGAIFHCQGLAVPRPISLPGFASWADKAALGHTRVS